MTIIDAVILFFFILFATFLGVFFILCLTKLFQDDDFVKDVRFKEFYPGKEKHFRVRKKIRKKQAKEKRQEQKGKRNLGFLRCVKERKISGRLPSNTGNSSLLIQKHLNLSWQ